MGGGGGGTSWSPRSEQEVQKELEKARERRNLFISFAYEDIDHVNLFRGHAKLESSNIEFVDRSVQKPYDSADDDYIKQQISRRIKQASMTAVYLSDNCVNSKWVDWEVKTSLRLGREVIAFYSGDNPPSCLPKVIEENNIKTMPWSKVKDHLK